jgi:hypothetical protein
MVSPSALSSSLKVKEIFGGIVYQTVLFALLTHSNRGSGLMHMENLSLVSGPIQYQMKKHKIRYMDIRHFYQ